jgi:hypothetical protein
VGRAEEERDAVQLEVLAAPSEPRSMVALDVGQHGCTIRAAGFPMRRSGDDARMARSGPDRDAWLALWVVALFLLAALVWLRAPYAG